MSNVGNGIGRTRKISARRSLISKRNSDEEDFVPEPSTSNRPEVPSTINQRPRRQVKHKFIKTGNRTSLTDELYTTLIGPNSPSAPALIPVVERLSDNVSNFAELLATKEFKLTDSIEMPANVEQEIIELKTNSKDPVNKTQKTLGIPMRRRGGRQTRTSNSFAQIDEANQTESENNHTEPETNHTSIEMAPPESVKHVMEMNLLEDDAIVTIEETDDRFEMDSSAFDSISNIVEMSGPVDYAEEVVIEETVTTTEIDQSSFAATCDDTVASIESDIEPIATEEVNDIIDVSDSLSFLNESDESDSRSIVDVPTPSSPSPASKPPGKNDAIDIDENSGSIILVSPSDPLENSIAATEEITSTTYELHLADDDTANDGDVDEISLNGPRRRSKRKSKSFAVEENSVNSDAVDCSFAITKSVDVATFAMQSDNSSLSPKRNAHYENNTKSDLAIGPLILPQNNFVVENLIISSEDTTQSELNDRSDAHMQRPRREISERINYSVRRNYVSRQSIKNSSESAGVINDNIDAEVDIELELEKSVIERPPPIEPKFKFKKTEQLRTYQRRQKSKGTKNECSSPPSSSSSSSLSSLASASSSTTTSISAQALPKKEQENLIAQNIVISNIATEQLIESTDSIAAEKISTRLTTEDAPTAIDVVIEPIIQKRRLAGRPRKSDARRKPPQQTNPSSSIENIATNIDASIEAVEKVEIVTSSDQEQVLPPIELQEQIQIEFKADLDVETKVPCEPKCTATEVTQTSAAPSPDDNELLSKVEDLVISADGKAIANAINAMEVDICKMEIDDEKPSIDTEMNKETQQPATICFTDMVDTTIVTVVSVPTVNDSRMEINANDQIAVKEGKNTYF